MMGLFGAPKVKTDDADVQYTSDASTGTAYTGTTASATVTANSKGTATSSASDGGGYLKADGGSDEASDEDDDDDPLSPTPIEEILQGSKVSPASPTPIEEMLERQQRQRPTNSASPSNASAADAAASASMEGLPGHLMKTMKSINAEKDEAEYQEVLAVIRGDTKKKKKKKKKKKVDDQQLGMGFFTRLDAEESQQAEGQSQEQENKRRKVEAGEEQAGLVPQALYPPWLWMPVFNEQIQTAMEYGGAACLPIIGTIFGYSSGGIALCFAIMTVHTVVTALTNLGPNSRALRFSYAPISPEFHKVLDFTFVCVQISAILFWKEKHFGEQPYHAAVSVFFAGMGDIVISYNTIVAHELEWEAEARAEVARRKQKRLAASSSSSSRPSAPNKVASKKQEKLE